MVRMAYCNRKRIRRIRPVDLGGRQEVADHDLDLLLPGMTGTHDRLLDEIGRVFAHLEARLGGRQECYSAREAEFQGRAWVLVDEGLLDRGLDRIPTRDNRRDAIVELDETFGGIELPIGADRAVRDMPKPPVRGLDDAPAGL